MESKNQVNPLTRFLPGIEASTLDALVAIGARRATDLLCLPHHDVARRSGLEPAVVDAVYCALYEHFGAQRRRASDLLGISGSPIWTGLRQLDDALAGRGIRAGDIVEITCRDGGLATELAMSVAVQVSLTKSDGLVLYISTGACLSPARVLSCLKSYGRPREDVMAAASNFLILPCQDLDELLVQLQNIIDDSIDIRFCGSGEHLTRNPSLVVIDTISMLAYPILGAQDGLGRHMISIVAKKLRDVANAVPCAVVTTVLARASGAAVQSPLGTPWTYLPTLHISIDPDSTTSETLHLTILGSQVPPMQFDHPRSNSSKES